MKKILSLIIAFALVLTALVSCGGLSKKDVIGEWKGADVEMGENLPEGMTEEEAEMAVGFAKMFVAAITFNFKSDGTVVTEGFDDTGSAKWKIDGGKLIVIDENNEETELVFDEEGRLVIDSDGVKFIFEREE